MRIFAIVAGCVMLGACAFQRAQVAQDAQASIVGLSKEQVLACMGPPGQKMAEGQTEVWAYASGDGTIVSSGHVNTTMNASGGTIYGSGSGISSSSRRFCQVNVTMVAGRVSTVNYQGPTGGLLTPGEQCAYVVQACVPKR